MPITSSAKKALRQEKRRTITNYKLRAKVRATLKTARTIQEPEALSQAFSALDTAAKRHIIHKNKAARLKSRLNKLVSKSAAPAPVVKKPVKAKPAATPAKAKAKKTK